MLSRHRKVANTKCARAAGKLSIHASGKQGCRKQTCEAALPASTMAAMPDRIETPSDVILTPHGLLLVENTAPPSPWLEVETGRRVAAASAESPARGLLHLGTRELNAALPAASAWWRELARRFLTQLCHTDRKSTRLNSSHLGI